VYVNLMQMGVYVGVCVCKRTLTHSAHGVLDVSPGVETRHLEGPKNADGLNLGIYVILSVLCTLVYVFWEAG